MTEGSAAGQVWSANDYGTHAGFVPELGRDVMALLDARPGERILDLGCGDGVLTARIAAEGASVTGLEPDPDLARAATGRGIAVLRQDAHERFGDRGYDAVFSNAALHWMRDPARVFANVFAALRPRGRFVAEQGGFGIVAAIVTALNAAREVSGLAAVVPWDFPSAAQQSARLKAAGFEVGAVALFPRPTPLPTGMAGWLATFGGPFVADADHPARGTILRDAERRLSALHDPIAGWSADYVRLRFTATRPD